MIDSYEFGKIKVDGSEYTSDVLIGKDGSVKEWRRAESHKLSYKDLESIVKERPQAIVVGTGEGGVMQVPPEVEKAVINRGIDFVADKTPAAVQKYNNLLKEGVKASAGFHLTC